MRLIAIFVSLVILGFSGLSLAATPEDAKQFAHQIGEDVLEIMRDESLNADQQLEKLESIFEEVVDVKWVARFVLGRHWRGLSPERQEEYVDAYRSFLIGHYTENFVGYSGETFELPFARQERDGEYIVRMEIQRPQGQEPIVVDYRLRENGADATFTVFDIVVEGVSLITTQRSEFGSVVERQGVDTLIAKLKAKG